MVAAAGRMSIAGEVGRDVLVSVGRLIIDGSVGGSLTYVSDDDAQIADEAVGGTVERIEPPQTPRVEISPWAVFVGWFLGVLYALVALSLITLLAGLLFPRWLHRVTDHLVPSPWKALLVGFVASIAVPVALLFLAVTIIGAPLALAGTAGVDRDDPRDVRVQRLLHRAADLPRCPASGGEGAGRRRDPHRRAADPVAEHRGLARDGVLRPRRPAAGAPSSAAVAPCAEATAASPLPGAAASEPERPANAPAAPQQAGGATPPPPPAATPPSPTPPSPTPPQGPAEPSSRPGRSIDMVSLTGTTRTETDEHIGYESPPR